MDLKPSKQLVGSPALLGYCAAHRIQWTFIAERAPWWGGFWERLVHSVKDALRKTLGRNSFTFEQLNTILIEIEATINSRPLTYISDDPRDFSPLCPSHVLVWKRLTQLPGFSLLRDDHNQTRSSLIDRAQRRQDMLADFWRRGTREYISELPPAHRFQHLTVVPFAVRELVLLSSTHQARALWPIGRITEVQPGRDGVIRACKVILPSGSISRRPLQLLHKLEV
ncbi:uncharacterized protein LOC135386462 [Ornithodoros turicata]|uniref:uncharacterized protein LOC135386462 n=1 Tax=Ornithodoros turicata TaxID=34597 RepID=UPI00313A0870